MDLMKNMLKICKMCKHELYMQYAEICTPHLLTGLRVPDRTGHCGSGQPECHLVGLGPGTAQSQVTDTGRPLSGMPRDCHSDS